VNEASDPRDQAELDDDFTYEPAPPAPVDVEQVSSLVAITRIVAVLAMGLFVSFGLFLMFVGVRGVIVGVPLVLMAVPCYFAMQLVERLANRAEPHSTPEA
jgi:hypothetical protein